MATSLLEDTIKQAVDDKHVSFIKVYDRLVRGVNMLTFPIIKMYAYDELYPSTDIVTSQVHAEASNITIHIVVKQWPKKDVHTDFFTPSTKKLLEEISHEMDVPLEHDQTSGVNRSLLEDSEECTVVSDAKEIPAAVMVQPEKPASSVTVMPVESPVKKNKNKDASSGNIFC